MTLIEAVREKRERQNLSLRGLSRIVGVSFSALARLERGLGTPNTHTQDRLARWLEFDEHSSPNDRNRPTKFDVLERRVEKLEKAIFQNNVVQDM